MKRALAVLAVALVASLAGCKRPGARLEGRWQGIRAEGVPADQQEQANTFAKSVMIDARPEVIAVTVNGKIQVGPYRVIREDKESVVITTDRDQHQQETFVFIGNEGMRWQIQPSQVILFQKQN